MIYWYKHQERNAQKGFKTIAPVYSIVYKKKKRKLLILTSNICLCIHEYLLSKLYYIKVKN